MRSLKDIRVDVTLHLFDKGEADRVFGDVLACLRPLLTSHSQNCLLLVKGPTSPCEGFFNAVIETNNGTWPVIEEPAPASQSRDAELEEFREWQRQQEAQQSSEEESNGRDKT